MARNIKTEAQRAQEALDVAEKRVTRLQKHSAALKAELQDVENELVKATTRRDYAALDPALPKPEKPRAVAS